MEQFAERANQAFAGILGDNSDDTLKLPNQWVDKAVSVDEDKRKTDFKKPKLPGLKRKNSTPDYLVHPDKWKRYDMSDVKLSSDSANAQSALSFLNDLKKRIHSNDTSPSEEDDSHIVFTRPVTDDHTDGSADESNSTTASFTVVMPEYVIGSKKKKVTKKTCSGTRNSSTHKMLKLSHLEDHEDELHNL